MKILLTLLILLNTTITAQSAKSSQFSVCSTLTENEIIDKIRLDENGIGQLNLVDDLNSGMKFKLLGIEKTTKSVMKWKYMFPDSVQDMMNLLTSKDQFFEMTESNVLKPYEKNNKSYSYLHVVMRPLPQHIRPEANVSHAQYYPQYMLKCALQESPIKLKCKKVCNRKDNNFKNKCVSEKYPNFLMKEVEFSIEVAKNNSCKGNFITVKHATEIYPKDYVKLLGFIIKETTGYPVPDFIIKAIAKPSDMPDNMMDDYMINLYKNWTK